MEIAEEEIERTSQEAVKAVLEDVGGELAYEKERADQLEIRNAELGMMNWKKHWKKRRILSGMERLLVELVAQLLPVLFLHC